MLVVGGRRDQIRTGLKAESRKKGDCKGCERAWWRMIGVSLLSGIGGESGLIVLALSIYESDGFFAMRIERGLGQIRELGRQDDPFAVRVGDRHVPHADSSGRNNTHDRRAVVGHNPNG